jgi:thioredoxin reductase (NADPH)
MKLYDVIILGAGPAGLTAAIYATRAKLSTLIVSGPMIGGQISQTYQVDNYPGFPEGITGPDLATKFKIQAEKFGAVFIDSEATAVDFGSKPYTVVFDGENVESNTVIVAMGMIPKKLNIPGENKLKGRGVFACATCDAVLYEDLKVAVIGGGDSAVQEALDLAKYASEVTIIHRRSTFKAEKYLIEKAKENPRIKFVINSEVFEIIGEKHVEEVKIRDISTGEISTLTVEGVLIAIGWTPNTSIFQGQLNLDLDNYIISKSVFTEKPGIFVAGDLNDRVYRQVVTSCASGCIAALEAVNYLEKSNQEHQ